MQENMILTQLLERINSVQADVKLLKEKVGPPQPMAHEKDSS